jgi:hypothetical protein
MPVVHVNSTGLSVLAASCHEHAAAVATGGSAPAVSDGFAATSAAVAAFHGDAEAVAATIAQRLTQTGTAASTAATTYTHADVLNSRKIEAVGRQPGNVEV